MLPAVRDTSCEMDALNANPAARIAAVREAIATAET